MFAHEVPQSAGRIGAGVEGELAGTTVIVDKHVKIAAERAVGVEHGSFLVMFQHAEQIAAVFVAKHVGHHHLLQRHGERRESEHETGLRPLR